MLTGPMTGEPSLDDLLDDEVMQRMLRRAGLDGSELRRRLIEIARGRAASDRSSRRRGDASLD